MKKQNITLSLALAAVFSSSVAFAETEVTGKIIHESAAFTQSGIGIGAATTSSQTADSHGQDVFKIATNAKVFVDGDVNDSATYHVELNAFKDLDSDAVGDYDSNESYTQRDLLREAYVDTETNGISIRAGKQQVVWGTADGMKLLDAINPTDYSEMAQNQMEDSRIPIWMLNAEKDLEDGGNWQFIVSEGKSSHFAGMGDSSSTKATSHSIGDQGHAFIMKGADTITGQVNGFLNVAPALGKAASAFNAAVAGDPRRLTPYVTETVSHFADAANTATSFEGTCSGGSDAQCLADIVHLNAGGAGTNNIGGANVQEGQNVITKNNANSAWDEANPGSMFEYMYNTSFSTFDNFVNMTTNYVVDHKDRPTVALKYKNTMSNGLNYSLNAIRGNDTNPYIEMQWEDPNGNKLHENLVDEGGAFSTLILSTTASGATDATVGGEDGIVANLKFTEKLNEITQVGGSFDTAFETAALGPVVFRGEALYQKGVMSPVVTRRDSTKRDLEHGFLVSSVKMEKGDRFKYVLGMDVTRLTNMLISFQFIQDMNLDYISTGDKDATNWKYTADMATMHMTNNLNKAEKNKEFYSVFLSKPFGASGEHRWNNIVMFEENGGLWNRLDAEYSINDDTQAIVEYNKYWGDENTQFGQLAKSSNVQVGVKYSF